MLPKMVAKSKDFENFKVLQEFKLLAKPGMKRLKMVAPNFYTL